MFIPEQREDSDGKICWFVGDIKCPNETIAKIIAAYLNREITYNELENRLNDKKLAKDLAYDHELEKIKKQAKKLYHQQYPPTKGKGR
ncbi:hypothetical protein [Leptotrichia wadei]|jgi:hypothetical protein|uniref:Oxidoreductase, short chain dehydrogenase/reductase family n=1 Tax=Leptotrichia wadei TaxID=157687 RepID=A0A510KJV7_9FUSO|nr:hypothetical protein [Leptotrichia wadei]BBM50931.1 oxidoreductase, short chain dehydrogenase/reductase family [Leptotrichia wadei]